MDSCGRPVLFVEARVVDEAGKDVPDGERGEIVYRSPQLCEGYWDKPEETAEAFRDGWFHSGDLAVRDEEGYFTIIDRVKDVINSGGVLVASRQVEDALYTHDAVAEVAVVGLPDERWIEAEIAAVVVARTEVTEAELLAHAPREARRLQGAQAGHLRGRTATPAGRSSKTRAEGPLRGRTGRDRAGIGRPGGDGRRPSRSTVTGRPGTGSARALSSTWASTDRCSSPRPPSSASARRSRATWCRGCGCRSRWPPGSGTCVSGPQPRRPVREWAAWVATERAHR